LAEVDEVIGRKTVQLFHCFFFLFANEINLPVFEVLKQTFAILAADFGELRSQLFM
jgi:hypothetical protein